MPTFEVEVRSTGFATITAATKREADEKARRGEYDAVRRGAWHAQVSKLRKVDDR